MRLLIFWIANLADTKHIAFDQPSDFKSRVWRYMDLSQLVSILMRSGLLFRRVDAFKDPYEGFQAWEHPEVLSDLERNLRPKSVNAIKQTLDAGLPEKERLATYVNCWILSEHESEAMWRLFGSVDSVVAIQSRYECLERSFDDTYQLGCVRYIETPGLDWAKYGHQTLFAFTHKRYAFKHESEVRLIRMDPHCASYQDFYGNQSVEALRTRPEIYWAPCDLNQIIDRLIVGPETPTWFSDMVKDLTSKLGWDVEVSRSRLLDSPYS